jgi:acyl carrier protein
MSPPGIALGYHRRRGRISQEPWAGSRHRMKMPRTPLQSAVADIWTEILGVEDVKPDQDFFELGGTSLHAARVLTKTRAAFEVKLSPQTLFDHPTLAGFAAEVDAARAPELQR